MGKDQDLLQAVKEQDAQAVSKILNKAGKTGKKLLGSSKKFNINYQDGDGMSSLHQASLMGNTGIMRTLLEAGAQVGVKDNRGMTPLHYAAWQGQIDPVRLLLHWMAPCNEQAFNGDLPLHLACQHGHVDVVNALLSQHASPTARNKEYKTPLDLACEFGRFSVVEVLLNCNVCRVLLEDSPEDLKDNFRTTCIHSAAKSGHTDIIKLLLQARVNINRVTLQGTPLHEASKYCRLEAVRLLLDCGADVNKTNSYDQTPLDLVNKFTTTKAAKDLKKLLKEASFAVYVCAVKDNYSIDPECLSFKEGDYISVQEQNSNGLWKGYVVRDGYMARPKFFPADKVVIIDPTDPEHADLHYPNNTPQYVQDGLQVSMPTGRGRFLGSSEEMRSGLSKESLTYSNRNSSASCDSGRGVSTGQLDSRIACGVSVVPSQHRLSNQSYESGVSSGRRSCHSNSSSSMGSLDRLEESAYSSRVNVMQLFQSGHSDREVLLAWLSDLQFEDYLQNFLHAGYDMPTISRMTPEDLTAIGITKPSHRKRLKAEIARLSICDGIPDYKPADLLDWLRMLKLDCYYETLLRQGFDNMDFVTDIMWEDLEEIGIKQLGHQKKIMLAVDRLKRLTHGGKRLSSNDCQKSCESLDSPGSVLSVEMVPTPQYSQEVSITKINPKKSTSGENLCRASSGPEMTTFQQPRDMGLGLSASSLNSSEYACVYPVGTSDNTGDRSKSGSNTPVHMEDASEHSGYVINNVDNLEFSPKAPSPIPPAVAPKPKPVAKIIGKSVSSVSHSSTSSSDSGIHGGDGSGQTTPTNTLKKHSTMQMNSANRREIVYAEPIKPSQVPSNSVPVSNFRSVSSPYGTLVSSHYSKSSEVSNSTAPSSAQPRTADTTSVKINGPMPSVSSNERRDVTDSVFNSAVLSASTNITSNVPVDKTIYQSGGVKKKVPPPPPPKRSNSMTETTRTEKVSVDSWGEPPHSAGILHEDAFTSCVKNLSARFGKMREEKREENSVDTASSSDSEEFPPPPPPIAMEIMTPKLHSYGIIGKSALRDSPERTGSLMQKHGNVSRNASFGEWSGSVGTLPHKRSTDYERVRGELESATMMRPSKGANSRDCNGGNDLNVSTVSIDSNSLPFANENVGTIKQKVLPGKPSIVHSEATPYGGERKVGLNSQMFDERSGLPHEYSNPSEGINHRPQLTRSPREMKKPHPAPPVAKKPVLPKPTAAVVPAQQTEDLKLKRSTETGDVLNDIDNMLADLTEELDAMLELEME